MSAYFQKHLSGLRIENPILVRNSENVESLMTTVFSNHRVFSVHAQWISLFPSSCHGLRWILILTFFPEVKRGVQRQLAWATTILSIFHIRPMAKRGIFTKTGGVHWVLCRARPEWYLSCKNWPCYLCTCGIRASFEHVPICGWFSFTVQKD